MKRDRNETDECRWWGGEDRSCSQDDDDLHDASSEQRISARGARDTALPTAEGKLRRVEEQVRWGRETSWSRLCSSTHQTQRSRSNETQWKSPQCYLQANMESHATKPEGKQHTARLKLASWCFTVVLQMYFAFTQTQQENPFSDFH